MAVRNCAEIGENLQKIITRLLANDNLVKLLFYTSKDPLSCPLLTEEQKREQVFEKLIRVVPEFGSKEFANSIVDVQVISGFKDGNNTEFRNVKIMIQSTIPYSQWIIKDTNLRPFAIMGEIQKTLDGKMVNGLGKITGGDFELSYLSEEAGIYQQVFQIITYE